jgi:hypothetical protein
MGTLTLQLSFNRGPKTPDGVLLLVDMGEGPFPVWFKLFRGEQLIEEKTATGFFCLEPGEYYVEGVLADGSKVKTQKVEVTPGMVEASKKPAGGSVAAVAPLQPGTRRS